MIDLEKLNPILEGYKAYFPSHWDDEKYKWEAIKHFQDHWDIDAENFGEMFKQATDKTFNLLASGYAYPRGMITNFAKADDEATRAMFRNLFDESQDLAARVDAFQTAAEEMRAKYDDGTWRNHYQNTNAISTYLWLRYPDKYYIYKYELFRAAARELSSDYMPKKNGSVETLIGGFQMYDEICEAIKANPEIVELFRKGITESCYPDPELKTATIDVGFYLARFYLSAQNAEKDENEWFPKPEDYTPELGVEDWVDLLNDSEVFTESSLKIVKRMKDYGGAATCTQLSIKYGDGANFYNTGSQSLAKRIAKKTGCPVMTRDTDNARWWPILYMGRDAGKNYEGVYIWRLRDELSEALDKVDLSEIPLYADSAPAIWKISHGSISEDNRTLFEDRKVAVVHSTTKAMAGSKVSQGENFMDSIKKGDYFYLCYGNSIRFLGQFTSDKAILNPEMEDGWYEREYRVIAKSKDTAPWSSYNKDKLENSSKYKGLH